MWKQLSEEKACSEQKHRKQEPARTYLLSLGIKYICESAVAGHFRAGYFHTTSSPWLGRTEQFLPFALYCTSN